VYTIDATLDLIEEAERALDAGDADAEDKVVLALEAMKQSAALVKGEAMLSRRYREAAAAARVLIAADRPPGDPLLRDAIAHALSLAPDDQRARWQAMLDAVDAGHTLRFKIRTPTGTLTPELFSEVESIFTPH
jgi:hypothetical protein